MKRLKMTPESGRRRGGLLVMVAISLLLMTLVAGVLSRAVMTQREYSRATVLRTQAEWIVQSAARRGATKLVTNSDYSGEVWNISADELDQSFGALATIQVGSDADGRREILVTVEYPPDEVKRVRMTESFRVE